MNLPEAKAKYNKNRLPVSPLLQTIYQNLSFKKWHFYTSKNLKQKNSFRMLFCYSLSFDNLSSCINPYQQPFTVKCPKVFWPIYSKKWCSRYSPSPPYPLIKFFTQFVLFYSVVVRWSDSDRSTSAKHYASDKKTLLLTKNTILHKYSSSSSFNSLVILKMIEFRSSVSFKDA